MRDRVSIRIIHPVLMMAAVLMQALAASGHQFLHITANYGLPHQQVQDLAIDNDRKLWIATHNGLGRFDGYDIRVFRKEFSLSPTEFIASIQ